MPLLSLLVLRWQGGASYMSMLALLNMLCNHCPAVTPAARRASLRSPVPNVAALRQAFTSILADPVALHASCPSKVS